MADEPSGPNRSAQDMPPGERYRRAVLTLDQVRRFRDRVQRDLA